MPSASLYKRVVLKLSGEALKGDEQFGISPERIRNIAKQIKQIHQLGVELAIVTGGGNFFRGVRSNNLGINRASADYMGMLATVINGIANQGCGRTFYPATDRATPWKR